MRLIADGTVDRDGVTGLAAQLGYTTRQLERLLQAEVGAGPLALARAQRTQTARVLIETTDLPFADVAFAAGFASIRQFNDTVRAVCDTNPTELRRRAGRQARAAGGCRALQRERDIAVAGTPAIRLRRRVRASGGHCDTRLRGSPRRCLSAIAAAAAGQRHRQPDAASRTTCGA